MLQLPQALAPLANYRQFIVFVLVPSSTRPDKTDKFPCDWRTGAVANAHDPAIWTDAQTAIATAKTFGGTYGVGFVFTPQDQFWFLDIDGCLQPDNTWSPLAQSLVAAFPGAAVEVSSSGNGLHIIGSGKAPEHGKKNKQYNLEFYTEARFVALTGTNAIGSAAVDFTPILPNLVAQFFPSAGSNAGTISGTLAQQWEQVCTLGPCEGWNGPKDDETLLARAMRSSSTRAAFGTAASFRDLWECNVEMLAKCYPDPGNTGRAYGESEVEAALAQHLCFWTGKDCARIERLMRMSALVRPKWDRDDYLPRTILSAYNRNGDYLTDKLPEPLSQAVELPPSCDHQPPRATKTEGGSLFLSPDEQIDMFAGCVYVVDIHKVLMPGGVLLKPEQFKVVFGGYAFKLDNSNERTTRDPWEAFTQNQAYRPLRADSLMFAPKLPPAMLVKDAGRTRVNAWWPVDVPRKVGDITPFMNHLCKLIPNERDRTILLSYMAAVVQYKGHKFQWAPLIQGVEGNGKSLLSRCVAEAVGRRYVHWPKASKLSEKFNAWMLNRVFYAVEDIYVADGKREVIEELKPMITGEDLEIEGKGADQFTGDICGNFIFNSNHKGAIQKTRNDRRFCVIYCAQQNEEDLARDGLLGDYFPKFREWLKADGFAIVSELLHTFPIPPEFDPTLDCVRAPKSSNTEEAIEQSLGSIEQEVLEVVGQGQIGFCGGWISSVFLDNLLEKHGSARRMTRNKRHEMLTTMGYVKHPHLPNGRVNNAVMPDGARPQLYLLKNHPHLALTLASDIARAYTLAQNTTMVSNSI